MDTNRLKRFATEARKILMQGVKNRLQALGFDLKTGEAEELPQEMEGGAVFMNDVVSLDFYNRWMSLFHNIQSRSIREVTEEAAYTWFNRFMAIRIMEKQGFIAPVLEYESEDIHVPAIVNDAQQGRFPDMREAERLKLMGLLEDPSKVEQQFALLVVAYCHTNPIVNQCFGAIADYTELLLPPNILSDAGFLTLLNHTEFISDEQYASAELIGWLYQFYISDRKDEAFAKKGKYDPDEIAPATQIFTPNWIVKYMVQNTIGRIYLDNNPYEEDVQKNWKYLVSIDNEQLTINNGGDAKGNCQLSILNCELEQLKVADLACGSGHILNEAFDLLYDLYVNEGYSRADAIKNIFRYNLVGIDIDTRAKQLATFALLMKACGKDKSFLDAKVMPRVYSMPRPINEVLPNYDAALPNFLMGSNQKMLEELRQSLKLMNNADTLGSIMKFYLSDATRNTIMVRVEEYEQMLANGDIITEENRLLLPYMRIILALTDKYAAICMNPPYMGSGRFDATLSNYVKNNYPKSKADLFAVFMDVAIDRLADCGKYGMINMHSWMFLSSFEDLRKSLLDNEHIDSLLHLGPRTFDELSGEVVQNAAFVISKVEMTHSNGTYFRLVDGRNCAEKEEMFIDAQMKNTENVYYPNIEQSNFELLPGNPIGYWVKESIIQAFNNRELTTICETRCGLATGRNDKFLRLWHEVDFKNIGFGLSRAETKESGLKWFPYDKAGEFRKWYGNRDFVLDWYNDGYELQNTMHPDGERIWAHNFNLDKIFQPHIGWSDIISANGGLSFRYFEKGFNFDGSANAAFVTPQYVYLLLGFSNSVIVSNVRTILNPTIHFKPGNFLDLPFHKTTIEEEFVKNNISISKSDWDSHENSWDFEANPLIAQCNQFRNDGCAATSYRIENFVKEFEEQWKAKFYQLKDNEEELNRQFIEIYGLQDELTPDVPLGEITILQQGEISIIDN